MSDARIQNITQFAAERGMVTDFDVQGHIHAGLRSMPTTKTYARWFEAKLSELMAQRDMTIAAYEAAVESGDIRRPPPATLEERANGHPDLASTQAAIRLLAKRAKKCAGRAHHER